MSVKYDREVDILYITFSENSIVESDEKDAGIILDYDNAGAIVGIEIIDASEKMKNLNKAEVEYN